MSDMGDDFKAIRAERAEKRRSNRMASAEILSKNGIKWTTADGGVHLMLNHPKHGRINFWPGTGLWEVVGTKYRNRGVHALIKFYNKDL